MIRSLNEINDEFRVEVAETLFPAQAVQPQDRNGDVADLVSSFESEAKPKPEAGVERRRTLLRRIIPIVCAIVAIILIIVATVLVLNLPASARETSGNANGTQTQDEGGAGDAARADAGSAEQGGAAREPGEGEYDSALESLENEINDARESAEAGANASDAAEGDANASDTAEGDASGEAFAYGGVAVLYRDLIAWEYIDEAVSITEPDALLSQENRRRLIERIDAHFSDRAGKDAPSLPTDEEINSDLEFTNLTEAANALVDAVNAGRESGGRLPEVIELRTKAYAIYPLGVLKSLLAIDFEDFGLYCVAADRSAAEALDSFISAVKYRTAYLYERPYGSDAYYAEIRRLGRIFAGIAEIGDADAAHKRHAELIAACLREMTAR
ncbi:MAG: hypothetical protein LBS24_03755 [Clostridiales Family XIII bacterium]|jgi:type II secretory pathway pseudopilin PulG|nr:hypothetical protein [Clostridiales Family XIII bacterium]